MNNKFSTMSSAINDWQQVSGLEVISEPSKLSRYTKSSLGYEYTVPCVLKPNSPEQLSNCVKIAYQHAIKIFPISTGQNHGYNSATSTADDTVIIDVSKMNKIHEFNSEFGYVILEPGVTFEMLYAYLAANDSDYMMSGFGGSCKASIIGNSLDRGVGKGVYGNREKSSEICEVILSDGTIVNIRNQMAFYDQTANFQHSIVGMDLGNLFYQSSLAIVSKMILHLEPIPETMLVLALSLDANDKLPQLVTKLKKLNTLGVIKPVYSIYNDIRLVVGSGLFQKKDVNLTEVLEEGVKQLSNNYGRELGTWNSSFAISCSCPEDADLKQRLIATELTEITSGLWFYQICRQNAKSLIKSSLRPDFMVKESDFKFLFNLGYTDNYDQRTLYWCADTQFKEGNDPVQDGCGLIFFAPKIPFSAEHIQAALKLCQEVADKYQMELPLTFQFKTEEIAYLVLPIVFNLNNESRHLTYDYYTELFNAFADKGYLPYRVNSISMAKLFNNTSNLTNLIRRIKLAFDDKNILSPNKYIAN